MGRRAKNKQGPPAPLVEKKNVQEIPSAKKLGKRKQEPETENRPTKKVKAKENAKPSDKSDKKNATKKQKKPKARIDESESENGSGWEDVEGDDDLVEEQR